MRIERNATTRDENGRPDFGEFGCRTTRDDCCIARRFAGAWRDATEPGTAAISPDGVMERAGAGFEAVIARRLALLWGTVIFARDSPKKGLCEFCELRVGLGVGLRGWVPYKR